jgi:hypothetical protein
VYYAVAERNRRGVPHQVTASVSTR